MATVRKLAVRLPLRVGSEEMSAARSTILIGMSSFLPGGWGLRSSYWETQAGAKPPWPRGMESYECTCRVELVRPFRRARRCPARGHRAAKTPAAPRFFLRTLSEALVSWMN